MNTDEFITRSIALRAEQRGIASQIKPFTDRIHEIGDALVDMGEDNDLIAAATPLRVGHSIECFGLTHIVVRIDRICLADVDGAEPVMQVDVWLCDRIGMDVDIYTLNAQPGTDWHYIETGKEAK